MTDTPDTSDNQQDAFTPSHNEYDDTELLQHGQANAQAVIIATVAYLQERGVPLDEWAAGMGRRFTAAWGAPEPWTAPEFLDAMLANLRSLGAEVEWADLDDPTVAAATLSGLFDEELCLLFGTERADVLHYLDATREIAALRGVVWEWQSDGDDVQIKVRAEGTASTGSDS